MCLSALPRGGVLRARAGRLAAWKTRRVEEPRTVLSPGEHRPGLFVVVSELAVDPPAFPELVSAFRDRAHLVDGRPGFCGLEVWQRDRDCGRFSMVSWWSSRDALVDYLHSDEHRASHGRIPTGPARPRPVALSRHRLVAT
jgi:heme-degrading monooxygenase HmoA